MTTDGSMRLAQAQTGTFLAQSDDSKEEQNASVVDLLRRPREVRPTAKSSSCFASSTLMTPGHVYTLNDCTAAHGRTSRIV